MQIVGDTIKGKSSIEVNDMLCLNIAKHLYPEYFQDTYYLNDGRIGRKSFKLEPLMIRELKYVSPGKADKRYSVKFQYKNKYHYASDLEIWEDCKANVKDLIVVTPEIGLVCRNDITMPDEQVILNMRDVFRGNVLLLRNYSWLQNKMNQAQNGDTPKRIFERCKTMFHNNGVTLIFTNELK
jgi:hypothetical protein